LSKANLNGRLAADASREAKRTVRLWRLFDGRSVRMLGDGGGRCQCGQR